MKQSRWIRWLVFTSSPVGAYFLAALVGSHIPVNRDWSPAEHGITIYITDNGWHTGLILPVSAGGLDLSSVFQANDLAAPEQEGRWLVFGWGDRAFYLNTPTWAEFDPRVAAVALTGSGDTLLHVDHLSAPEDAYAPRPIKLSQSAYRHLVRRIFATVKFSQSGYAAPQQGYGQRDVFYEARGRYTLFNTCNIWVRDVLAAAGVKTGWWTPISGGLMRWYPPDAQARVKRKS